MHLMESDMSVCVCVFVCVEMCSAVNCEPLNDLRAAAHRTDCTTESFTTDYHVDPSNSSCT